MEERFRVRVREYSSSFLSFLFFFAVGLFLNCFFFFVCLFVFSFGLIPALDKPYSGPINFVTDSMPCVLDEENKPG